MSRASNLHPANIPPAKRSILRRLLGATLGVAGSLLLTAVLAASFLIARQPRSSGTMRFVSAIALAPAKGLVSGTDYAIVRDHTLYVAYSSADTLLAVDTRTGAVRSFATGLKGLHGVAFSQNPALAFASVGGSAEIAALTMPAAAAIRRIPAGTDPDGIVFNEKLGLVYAGNGKSDSATLVSVHDLEHPMTIPLGGSPEYPQVDETTGLIYQPLEDKDQIAVIDPRQQQVVARFPIPQCEGPKGSAIDMERKVLFVGCSNQLLAVMDLASGRVLATVPIGRFVDFVGWDSGLHRVYTANSAGSMTVIGQSTKGTYEVLDTVRTRAGGHTLAVDSNTHRVYVICSRLRGAQILTYEPFSADSLPLR
jgi:DNA-binding beta-propeller fold protein YncE